ncbi:MAG: chitobiase/beta-hexosaminidase C-terminal domain-containing protein [Candidatus Cloacimonadaceae bacterium]
MKTPVFLAILILALTFFSCVKPTTELIQLDDPMFSHASGTYLSGQAIYLTCSEYGASIYYTTDGSEPSNQSSLYANPLIIPNFFPDGASSATLKARAYKEGFDPSDVASATYSVTYFNTVATPHFAPLYGDIDTATEINIQCSTLNADIYYTLDGSEPTQASTLYSEGFTILQTGEVTLKARAYRSNWNPSEIAETSYTVSAP